MSRRRRHSRAPLLPLLAALALVAAVACDGAAPPVAPAGAASPDAPRFARGGTVQQTRPDGKGIGTTSTKGGRTSQPLAYHDGGLFTAATPTVYVIWYGLWGNSYAVQVLNNFLYDLSGSSYFAINTVYHDANGAAPSGSFAVGQSIEDRYSRGANLTDSDVMLIVSEAAAGGLLPVDPNGIYVVFTTPDVDVTSGLGSTYCGYHTSTGANGISIPLVLVGAPSKSTKCGYRTPSPNGSGDGDAMASILAAELSNVLTDPWFNGWYDKFFFEPADKCAWTYGATYTSTPYGGLANVRLGAHDYLLQQLWVPGGRTGACALDLGAGMAAANAS